MKPKINDFSVFSDNTLDRLIEDIESEKQVRKHQKLIDDAEEAMEYIDKNLSKLKRVENNDIGGGQSIIKFILNDK